MSERNLGSVLVTHANEVIGLFTERDLVRRVVAAGLDPAGTALGVVCSRQIFAIAADASCEDAVFKMHTHGCRRLLVYRGPEFVGVVKLQDLAVGLAGQGKRRDWLPNVFVGMTLLLILGVIILLAVQLPDMLAVVRSVRGH